MEMCCHKRLIGAWYKSRNLMMDLIGYYKMECIFSKLFKACVSLSNFIFVIFNVCEASIFDLEVFFPLMLSFVGGNLRKYTK